MAATDNAPAAIEPTTPKVFVGNLPFAATSEDLMTFFSDKGVNVIAANIITRGTRSLGYGFIDFATEEDAQACVTKVNKAEYEGRELNLEVAKPQDPNAPKKARKPRRRNKSAAAAAAAATEGGEENGGEEASSSSKPRRRRAPRAPREPRDDSNRVESQTLLFVANLPFSVDDDGLGKIFEGISIKTAHVVTKINGRSKGYGFVDFATSADRAQAISTCDGKSIEGREISLKPALAPLESEETAE